MKRKGLIIAGVVGGIILLLLAVPLFVNVDGFRPRVEAELSTALGREVKIGKLSFSMLAGCVRRCRPQQRRRCARAHLRHLGGCSPGIGWDLLDIGFEHAPKRDDSEHSHERSNDGFDRSSHKFVIQLSPQPCATKVWCPARQWLYV